MLTSKLRDLEQQKELLVAEETILMRKALQSDDPHAFIKAQTYYQQIQEKNDQVKSFFVDHYDNPEEIIKMFHAKTSPTCKNDVLKHTNMNRCLMGE